MYRKKFKKNLVLCIFFLLIIVVGISSWLSPSTFSNFVTIENVWSGEVATSFDGGNGTEANPYQISNGEELAYFKQVIEGRDSALYRSKYYVLTADINMGNLNFETIGSGTNIFNGILDGQGHTIANLKIIASKGIDSSLYTGIFTKIDGANISNLNLTSVTINTIAENNLYVGVIAGSISNDSSISNLSLTDSSINIQKNEQSKENIYIGSISGENVNSKIANSYIKTELISEEKKTVVGSISGKISETSLFDNILLDCNVTDSNINSESVYTKDNVTENFLSTLNENVYSKDYKWVYENDIYYLKINEVVEKPNDTKKRAVSERIVLHDSGISDNTVYVNDLDSDYNYYMGLNYTYSEDGRLPSMENKKVYSDDNLVTVQTTYYGGMTKNGETYHGTVSVNETQDTYVYYNLYPVNDNGTASKEDDYVEFELIDNPFTNRPADYGFNGWRTDYFSANISYDDAIYTRYVRIPINYNGSTPEDINIKFDAVWVSADIYFSNSTSSTNLTNAINSFKDKSMQPLVTYEIRKENVVYGDINDKLMDGYYVRQTVNYRSYYPANSHNASGSSLSTSSRCNTRSGCTVYVEQVGKLYDEDTTYYELIDENMEVVNHADIEPPMLSYDEVKYPLYDERDNMSTFYKKVNLSRGQSLAGYYDETGVLHTSGTCGSTSCTYYDLIQYYDDNGSTSNFDIDEEYYYLVTRDTNLIVVRSALTGAWGSSQTKPLTVTSSYDGREYNPTWTLSNAYIRAGDDLGIENITIYSAQSRTEANATSGVSSKNLYGYYNNVKIGRGIKASATNQSNFASVIGGGNQNVGSSSSPTPYRLIVESGYYNTTSLVCGATTSTYNVYVHAESIYGNDYDRVANNDNNLDVYYTASGSWGCNVRGTSTTDTPIKQKVKSGKFGSHRPTDYTNSNTNSYTYGIYVGGRAYGGIYATRQITVEGGWIYNLIGGPLSQSSSANYNDDLFYIKGGSIDAIIGGAGRSETYGNRVIQVTDGTINYSVFGGSNGITGSGTEGVLTGSPYIYIGGNATIGNQQYVDNNSTLFGFEAGSVFGIGNGKAGTDTIGTANNSYIIIDGEANILRNVYGGGNYGAVGISSSLPSSETKINVLNGNIHGSIFGGGNRNGSGDDNKDATITINVYDGTVGSIYGGSNEEGSIHGDVVINHYGGVVNNDIYGGGYGGTTGSSGGTFVRDTVEINVGDESYTTTPTINGSVYGGSAFGTVNGLSHSTAVSKNGTTVNINKGIIKNSVFGGGRGNGTYTPYVLGDITVNINGGNITDVFGGNDAAGTPNGEVTVNLNDGIIGRVFGGGNNASVKTNHVNLQGSTVTSIFGGSNSSGTVTESNVIAKSGVVETIYGGNNVAGNTVTSNVTIEDGTIKTAVYGGGRLAKTQTTNVTLNGTTVPDVFGGGENADVTDGTHVVQNGTTVTNLYGGSNAGGNIATSSIIINGSTTTNVFGGNNIAGLTSTTNITMNDGTVTNMYGGGNKVGVTTSNINLDGGTITTVFGGSNQDGDVSTSNIKTVDSTKELTIGDVYGGNNLGGTTSDPTIDLEKGTYENVFGGGNRAETTGNAIISVKNSTVNKSIYGGGNQAGLLGNTTVFVLGETTVNESIFGGGNHGPIGETGGSSLATVNVAGAVVGKNVYGGCNTSVVNGKTQVNIGFNAISDIELNDGGDINIAGTVFGGGEANEAGSEIYDFEAISVTDGIDIVINGTGYGSNALKFKIHGSIFGSGNASSSSGPSNIIIKSLGTRNEPNSAISIQRADSVTLDNSTLELVGTTDRTNEYSTILYSLNRIKKLKLKNNATLLLQQNANMLEEFDSIAEVNGEEVKATVTIDKESGTVVRNVDNRLYMLAGKNLNVTKNEKATDYGIVSGMTFLGMYQNYGTIVYGMYDYDKTAQSSVSADDLITGGSYVLGLHKLDHNIEEDGYYTNYINDSYDALTVDYVEPTPPDSNFYRWTIGTSSINYSFSLTASKYSSLGTYELSMTDFTEGNTIFNVIGFNGNGLAEGVSLKDSTEVPKLAPTEEEASKILGLSMKAETIEWTSHATTRYTKDENGNRYLGDVVYETDNQTVAPSLMFYLYHAKNITGNQKLGTVVVTLQALTPINEIEHKVELVTITITIDSKEYDDKDAYDGSITFGKKYEMPSAVDVNITNKSQFTAYFSLFESQTRIKDAYGSLNDYHHALVSSYVFPVGTKITMIDYGANEQNPAYYYYIVDEESYQTSLASYEDGQVSYRLSNFIRMDSIDKDNTYNDIESNNLYYHADTNYVMEEFIFIFDFEDTDIQGEQLDNTILFELHNDEDFCITSVLGIRQELMKYNLYQSSNVALTEEADMDTQYLYYDTPKTINYHTSVGYELTGSLQSIVDTNYESSSMGINVTLFNASGDQVSSSQLGSTTIVIDDVVYYVDSEGIFRIKLTDKVANLTKNITMMTGPQLPTGRYTMRIALFASNDGLHNSSTKQPTIIEKEIVVVGNNNLIVSSTEDNSKLVIGETGLNMDDAKVEKFTLKYQSVLQNPNIRLSVYRRDTQTHNTNEYVEISPNEIFTDTFSFPEGTFTKQTENEHMVTTTPTATITLNYNLRDDLKSGTYRVLFKLYDGNQIIEEDYEYIIIRKNV